MLSQPFDPIREIGITELVGKDKEVNTSDFGGSVEVDVSPGSQPASGEFLAFLFVATESGDGAVQDSAGKLLILDADDWIADANGGVAYIHNQVVPFHNLATVYLVWYHEDDTDLNDAAGDDEVLQVNAWYKRYS